MRASRLVSILTTLQARGRATAPQLAAELEVSLRTIYRDIDALSAAGVPVYAERGPEGGYRLLDGYRLKLNGLSRAEAEALFLAGLPAAAAQLGLGGVMAAAETKLLAAMPEGLRASAEVMRGRFHLDAPGWFDELEQPDALQAIAQALWANAPVVMRYQSRKAASEQRIEPLGLVLKGGVWYLVGRIGEQLRTYRVGRIAEVVVLDERFEPPAGFDLRAHWRETAQDFEDSLYTDHAIVRLSPRGAEIAAAFGRARANAVAAAAPEPDGWREVALPIESLVEGRGVILRLGADAEVLGPPALRAAVAEAVATMHGRYAVRPGTPLP